MEGEDDVAAFLQKKPRLDDPLPHSFRTPAASTQLPDVPSCATLADTELKLQRAMAQVAQAQQEAWLARQDALRLEMELSRLLPRRVSTLCDPAPVPSVHLFADDPEFAAVRMEGVTARVELLAGMPEIIANARLSEVAARQLTDFEIECALHRRKAVLDEKYGGDGLSAEDLAAKIKFRVLQLLRVLHRRRLAILNGHKLPPRGSLFAQMPE